MRTGFVVCAAVAVIAAAGHPAVDARGRQDGRGESAAGPPQAVTVKPGDLLYADFENSSDAKPVSARGGAINLWTYQEQPTRPSIFKGPSLVRTSKTDNNHAAAFEYEFAIPNEWQGVTMEVQGQAGTPGALPQDDVTGYKDLRVQAYVTGTSYMRVEIMVERRAHQRAQRVPDDHVQAERWLQRLQGPAQGVHAAGLGHRQPNRSERSAETPHVDHAVGLLRADVPA